MIIQQSIYNDIRETGNLQQATLPVMEAFYTLQGEGFHQGKAAYFVRLGGCDVGCFWCDVKESWDATAHPQKTITQIIEDANNEINHPPAKVNGELPAKPVVVITGGEPLMHNLDELTLQLQKENF